MSDDAEEVSWVINKLVYDLREGCLSLEVIKMNWNGMFVFNRYCASPNLDLVVYLFKKWYGVFVHVKVTCVIDAAV